MSKKTIKESMKTSENNWLHKLTEDELAYYYRVCDRLQKKYDKYEQPTYKEVKAKINKARRNGRIYETTDRNAAFHYIAVQRYTVDMIARYDGRRHRVIKHSNGKKHFEKNICVVDIYLYVRETEEVVHIVDHMWMNDRMCNQEVHKYYYQYGELREGIVFIPFLKGIKYDICYLKDIPQEEVKYQLVTGSRHERTLYIQHLINKTGVEYTYDYVREHLYEL